MKKLLLLMVFCLAGSLGANAQEWANFRGMQRIVSPEVNGNSVTFRLNAPNATAVSVSGSWKTAGRSVAMTKDDAGVWSATVTGLEPELYNYTFTVDGVGMTDPSNTQNSIRDGARFMSIFIISGPTADLYASVLDVPHGNLEKVWYKSPTLNLTRRMYVYTPAGYNEGTAKYPVFYLLHGMGGDEDAWSSMGRAVQILDNMIAAGKAKPMILVMTNGNANQAAATIDYAAAPVAAPAQGGMGGGMGGNTTGLFEKSIVDDVVPFIDKNYRTLTDPQNRAIAGLSMGGAQTSYAALNNIDKFAWIGSFSGAFVMWPNSRSATGGQGSQGIDMGAVEKTVFPNLNSSANSKLKLLYIAIGSDDSLIESNRQFTDWLKTKNINHTYIDSPGYAHEWSYWRICLVDFAGKLFK